MHDHTLPDPTQATPRDAGAAAPALVVIEDESTWRFPLPLAGAVVIGRHRRVRRGAARSDRVAQARPAAPRRGPGVRRRSRQLQRHHRQRRSADRRARAAHRRRHPGVRDDAGVPRRRAQGRRRAVLDDAALHQRLALELDRAARYQRAVTICRGAVRDRPAPATSRSSRSRAAVRSIDTVGTDGATSALVVLPELTSDERGPALAALVGALRGRGARVGWAGYPDDGVGAATLLAAARAAAAAAPLEQVAAADALARRMTLGDATVLIAEPAMLRAFALIERFAVSELPMLILGETGVGKDSAAVAVHHYSRRTGPLRTINCAAIAEGVVESELFGHERGAFSGAIATRIGLFEAPPAARCSSTRSASCRWRCRPSSCACSTARRSRGSARSRRGRSTCGWWPRPTATCATRSPSRPVPRGPVLPAVGRDRHAAAAARAPARAAAPGARAARRGLRAPGPRAGRGGAGDDARAGGLPLARQHPRAEERDGLRGGRGRRRRRRALAPAAGGGRRGRGPR